MRFDARDYYQQSPRPRLVPGAVFLNVPIPFFSGRRLPAVIFFPDRTFRDRDFSDAWTTAPESLRDEGLPVLLRAKARPVLVLRVGAAVTDGTYHQSVWVAPIFSEKAVARDGPNIFPLPAWTRAGLRLAGFADFYQATMVPQHYFRDENYACELSPDALTLLFGALAYRGEGDPHP